MTAAAPVSKIAAFLMVMGVQKFITIKSLENVFGAIAQLGERNTGSVEVSGSIPLSSTNLLIFGLKVRRHGVYKCCEHLTHRRTENDDIKRSRGGVYRLP